MPSPFKTSSKKERARAEKEERGRAEIEQAKRVQFRWGPKTPYEWTVEESARLRNNFQNEQRSKGHTFLLFGPTSHGKSSFGNGCVAAVENRESPCKFHHVAQDEFSVTKGFKMKMYKLHRIVDMPGIFEGKAIKSDDIRKIVTGEVPWDSKVSLTLETPAQKKAYNNTVECVIIIIRYDCEFPPELKRQFEVIWNLCGEEVLSCHLVLTHLDVCDPQFKDTANLPNIYKSDMVLKAVEKMSKETGIPPYNISFVKNYTAETETDLNGKLQYLRILNLLKEAADDVVEGRETKNKLGEEFRNKDESYLNSVLLS